MKPALSLVSTVSLPRLWPNSSPAADELVVVYGHHSLETMQDPRPDERAGPCRRGWLACDADPRRSTPLHRGAGLRSLLLRHRNVVLFVTGHVHRHRAEAHLRRRGGGFWQVTTASHISFPQQTRLIELMDNRDGTLSIFATALDTAAPAGAPNLELLLRDPR